MANLAITPEMIAYIVVVGLLPALIWLWFWLKEDNVNPEPRSVLFFTFVLGAISVIFVIPLQRIAFLYVDPSTIYGLSVFAGIEEILKFLAVGGVALPAWKLMDEPVDLPIYFITAALGFAALENSLFLVDPELSKEFTVGLLAGQLRFLGSTLLHAVASATIGVSVGLAFYKSSFVRKIYAFFGLFAAVALHTAFNFFIIKRGGDNILMVYGILWVATVFVLLIFEKLRRMSNFVD